MPLVLFFIKNLKIVFVITKTMFHYTHGNLNSVYSSVLTSDTLLSDLNNNNSWKLTEREEKINSFMKFVNNRQGFEEMKNFYINDTEELVNPLQEPDFRFVKFILKIREQIFSLKIKYQNFATLNDTILTEIENLNKFRETLIKQSEEYNRIILNYHIEKTGGLNPNDDNEKLKVNESIDKQLSNIRNIVDEKNRIVNENETKMIKLLNTANFLKKVIEIPEDELKIEKIKEQQEPTEATKAVCVICSSRSIEYCLIPCGHCFCGVCCDKVKTYCHICQKPKASKMKIFYD